LACGESFCERPATIACLDLDSASKAPEMTKTIRGPRGPAGPTGERGQRRLRSARPERSTRHATKAIPTDRATLLAEVNGHIETFTRTRRADETDELRSSSRLMNFARR